MIDWINLAANVLWILALSIGLSTVGILYYRSTSGDQPPGAAWRQSGPQAALSLAGFLFCTGLLLTSDSFFQRFLWALLALAFVVQWLVNRQPGAGRTPK